MTALVVLPHQLVVDSAGLPRSGAKLYVYDADTVTPRASYTTSELSSENAHPVLSLATGLFPPVWVDPSEGPYKLVLKDSADVTLYTEDDISAIPNYDEDDVRSYGAKGDGSNDDTAEIQAALDAGGRVFFPPGDYKVTDTLEISESDTHIEGFGARIFHETATESDVIYAEGLSNISIRGIEVDGRKSLKSPSGSSEARGIHMYGIDNLLIEGCNVHDCVEHGIRVGQSSADPDESTRFRISDNLCKDNGNSANDRGWGIWLFGWVRGGTVTGNVCWDNQSGGIQIDDSSGDATADMESWRIAVTGNLVYSPGTFAATARTGIGISGTRQFSLNGNVVSGYNRGIHIASFQANEVVGYASITGNMVEAGNIALQLIDAAYLEISGNTFHALSTTVTDACANIYSDGGVETHHVSLMGNTFLCASRGIDIDIDASTNNDSHNILVSNNRLHYIHTVAAANANQIGVSVGENAGSIWVRGNTITSFYDGVKFNAATPAHIVGNEIINSQNVAISIAGTLRDFVADNFCRLSTTADILVGAGANTPLTMILRNTCLSTTPISGGGAATREGNVGFGGTTETATNIAAVAHVINTARKYAGKLVFDSTNNRIMRASGSAAADPWHVADGSATVTPS